MPVPMTMAEDHFAAMQRVEPRLNIVSEPKQKTEDEVVKVQESEKVFQLIQQLEVLELCTEARLGIASQLRKVFTLTLIATTR